MIEFAYDAVRAVSATSSNAMIGRVGLRRALLPLVLEARRRGMTAPALIDLTALAITELNGEPSGVYVDESDRQEMLVALALAWYDA